MKRVGLFAVLAVCSCLVSVFLSTNTFASTNTEFETGSVIPVGSWTKQSAIDAVKAKNSDFNDHYDDYSIAIWGRPAEGYFITIGKGTNSQGRNALIFGRYADGMGVFLLSGYSNSSFCNYTLQSDNTLTNCSNGGNGALPASDDYGYVIYALKDVLYAPDGGMTESWFKPWNSEPISLKTQVYPTMTVSTDKDNNVIITYDPSFLKKYNLPAPQYVITTLEDSTHILPADRTVGFIGYWDKVPNGVYTAHLDVVYTDPTINANYEFKDSMFKFTANHEDYSIIFNSTEDKYCSVRNGVEWNCTISQPQDTVHNTIDGTAESRTDETCDLTHLNGCWNNFWYGFLTSIGVISEPANGSPLLQFSTDTHGLTAIISAPLAMLNALTTDGFSCSTINLPLPFVNRDLPLPCMGAIYTTNFGSFFSMYQLIVDGLVSYWVVVKLLAMMKGLKDPENDKIEVLDL